MPAGGAVRHIPLTRPNVQLSNQQSLRVLANEPSPAQKSLRVGDLFLFRRCHGGDAACAASVPARELERVSVYPRYRPIYNLTE